MSVRDQVQKQVEFYFSDSNFRRDKFLQQETAKHADRFIPFSVLFTFKKLAALTTDPTELAAALEGSDVVEMNETKDALRRKHDLPENDDSAKRMLVLAGLGSQLPTIEDIKNALAVVPAEPLYIHRKSYNRKFCGVAHVEFADVETLELVIAALDKLEINQHHPKAMPLEAWRALPPAEQVEFEKAVHAMLVAKDVPEQPVAEFYEAFQPVFQTDEAFRARLKVVPETHELYVLFTETAFAERVLDLVKEKQPIVVAGKTLEFTLVTDKAAIAARPHSKREDKKDNKRKREHHDGKCIYISNIKAKVRMDEIKQMVNQIAAEGEKLPFIEYNGLDTAMFYVPNADRAQALFDKLVALPEDKTELGGQRVKFHLLNRNEELHVEVQYEHGLIVRFDAVDGDVSRDDIKDAVNAKLGEKAEEGQGVAYIKYDRGSESGFLRVASAEVAGEVIKLLKAGLDVNGVSINQAQLVEGEEEKQFWVDARKARSNRFSQSRKSKNSSYKRNRGN